MKDKAVVEAILFGAKHSLKIKDIMRVTGWDSERAKKALEAVSEEYSSDMHGVELRELARGYRFTTKEEYAKYISSLARREEKIPERLSHTLLETLAIIAYKQPVSKRDIERLKGGYADYALSKLLSLNLIRRQKKKRKNAYLYETTDEFLEQFGLSNMEEIKEWAKQV